MAKKLGALVAPAYETVATLSGEEVIVRGLHLGEIINILVKFPDLEKILAGLGSSVSIPDVLEFAPKAIPVLLMAGLDLEPGQEHLLSLLGVTGEAEAITKILKLTAPEGLSPLLARLEEMMKAQNMGQK